MTMNRMDPRKQFSKWLARWVAVFWACYLVLLVVLVGYKPEAFIAAIILGALTTVVMVTSVLAYTDNSKYEKGLYAPNQIAKNVRINVGETLKKKEDTNDEEADLTEDGENG